MSSAVASLYDSFKQATESGDLANASTMLPKLKIEMTKFSFLASGSSPTAQNKQEMLLARSILETATLLSAKKKDMESFERNISQLKPYYQSPSFAVLDESPLQYTILGLNLLRLLANTRIADFHTELELIPTEMLDNALIKHPIQLEQYLMEGSYTKVIKSRNEVPSSTYQFVMDELIDTVREEIAECSEKAYADLTLSHASKLFMYEQDELKTFAESRDWAIEGDRIVFPKEEEKGDKGIPASKLIVRTLFYARELERIV